MYKPMAEKDERKVSALLNLYGKIYRIVGITITIIGLCLIPFLNYFISGMPEMPNLSLIYVLYLFNTSLSYFFVYKKSILIVDQNAHIVSIIQICVTLLQNFLQIGFLLIFKNFIVYLTIQVVCTLLNNVAISIYVDKNYKFLKVYKYEQLDNKMKKDIKKNIAAMFLIKVSSAIVSSTDSLMISSFVSTVILGFYSNYLLFTKVVGNVMSKIFDSIMGSVGNLLAIESPKKAKQTYYNVWFFNFWLIYCGTISLFVLVNPAIELFWGSKYVFETNLVFLICVNLFMRQIRDTSLIYIDTYGLFWNVKIKCVIEVITNIFFSIVFLFVLNMGIYGVLLGTFVSNIVTNFWIEPYILFEERFKAPVREYFIKFLSYIVVTFSVGLLTYYICHIIPISTLLVKIIADFIICMLLPNILFIVVFHKLKEFEYFRSMISKMLSKIIQCGK